MDEFDTLTGQQISSKLHAIKHPHLPVPINRPWSTILLIFFLFICGGFFLMNSYKSYMESKTMWEIVPPFVMAFLLLITSIYHLVILGLIIIGYKDYNYQMLQLQ